MARLSEIEGAEVWGPDGERLGTVERVLFHPSEPRAVALMVRPNPALLVVTMPVSYVPWRDVRFDGGGAHVSAAKLPTRRPTEKALGVDMDASVVWRSMPVSDAKGATAGSVADAVLGDDGSVAALDVSTGGVGDLAYGRLEAPGASVAGFKDGAVRLDIPASQLVSSGGLARKAAEVSEAAKAAAATVATATGEAVVDASFITGRAIRTAIDAKPLKRAKSALAGLAGAFREGYDESPAADEDRGDARR